MCVWGLSALTQVFRVWTAWQDILRAFAGWLSWIKSLFSFVFVCVCGGFGVCLVCFCASLSGSRSLTPSRRVTLHQRCGGSSVWAMPSCSVPLSSSWGACFSWRLPCFSWMTGKRQRNSKWLRHCWNNSSLFHLLFIYFFKYLRPLVLHWCKYTASVQ